MIRTLVVDDSALVQKLLTDLLSSDPDIEVVGVASDPYEAREMIKRLNPDVLTLDVEMPKMNGLDFLRNLMRLRPMPVVMISTLTEKGAQVTLEALSLGAVEVVSKPKMDLQHGLEKSALEITTKVKNAAAAKVSRYKPEDPAGNKVSHRTIAEIAAGRPGKAESGCGAQQASQLIAIGASTGGTEAIKGVLSSISGTSMGIVITQHIPEFISASFAARMDQISVLSVCQAENNQKILSGHVYIAPGGQHLSVVRDDKGYKCKLTDSEPVNRHKPSVDVLFRSVARVAGSKATGVILTGMGADGAVGLKEMQDAGASTIAQDEASCVIFGMPKEAIKLGAADMIKPLQEIAPLLSDSGHAACA